MQLFWRRINIASDNEYPLSGYRVLDLTDDKGYLCGRILAELGADVIKIEPPAGDSGRKTTPFYHNEPDPQKSLYWFAYNADKRGITLNLEATEGRDLFLRLVQKSDVIIESFAPGYLRKLELDYAHLSPKFPCIILASITPFGQDSQWKEYSASDLVGAALGGMMYLLGDPDREPLCIGAPQSYLHASGEAAVGTLIALYHREVTGEGQHVDCSMMASWLSSTANSIPFWELNQRLICRAGIYRTSTVAGVRVRQIWRCKDGHIALALLGGGFGAKTNRALVDWMEELGEGDEFLNKFDWEGFDFACTTQELQDKIEAKFEKFLARRTLSGLFQKAVEKGMQVGPVLAPRDLIDNPHLKARGFWQEVEHPELDASIVYPGPCVRFSETAAKPIRRAPLIGEHNEEVYQGELGISSQEFERLKKKGII